jgi:hypothetical protein
MFTSHCYAVNTSLYDLVACQPHYACYLDNTNIATRRLNPRVFHRPIDSVILQVEGVIQTLACVRPLAHSCKKVIANNRAHVHGR